MKPEEINKYISVYKNGILEDTLPFWIKHSIDYESGGFMFSVNRDDSILDTDKGMWQTCRFTWLLGTLYNEVEKKYKEWHKSVHDWTYAHFPDPEFGEWYGYLHRDGRISVPLKGNLWKGPFHIPRMQLYAWKILEELKVK